MQRTLTPEILDSLPPDDPAARHSRRDLRVFNAVLGGSRWLRNTLPSLTKPGERVLEVGAGAGEFGADLARRGFPTDGLDLGPRPASWPAEARWHQADAMAFDGWRDYAVVFGNLVFHHFDADSLRALGSRIAAHAQVIVACETLRRPLSRKLFPLLCTLVGANQVSRHDGRVSIEAGFLGDELPQMFGLDPAAWRWRVRLTLRGLYQMVAERRA